MFKIWSLTGDRQSYKHFSSVGHFPTNFQWPLVAKLVIGSKKLGGAKMGWTYSITHAEFGGDRRLHTGCRRKSVMFFLFVTLSNDKVCDNRNAIKKYNSLNNYDAIT